MEKKKTIKPKEAAIQIKKTIKPKIVVDKRIYPIGKFEYNEVNALKNIEDNINAIKQLPKDLKKVMKQINKHNKLNSYRDGGWTIEQIIHHLADSHMNAFIRFKLALTESNPIIKPYDQDLFAETSEIFIADIKSSYSILKGIHKKLYILSKNMDEIDFKRSYTHPEYKIEYTLLHVLASYAWHGKHHIEQIKVALSDENLAE